MSKTAHSKSTAVIIAAIIIIVAGIMASRAIIVPMLLALFISVISAQPIHWMVRKKIPQGIAIFIVLIGIFSILFAIGGVNRKLHITL